MTPYHASLLRLSLVRLGIFMPHVRLLKKSPCCKSCVFIPISRTSTKGVAVCGHRESTSNCYATATAKPYNTPIMKAIWVAGLNCLSSEFPIFLSVEIRCFG